MRFAAVLSLVAVLAPVAVGASYRTAHVTVPDLSPFTVRGSGFRSNERVRVTVSVTATRTKSVIASARGTFKATFSGISIGSCDPYAVRAKGSRGSSAFLKVMPECAPPGPSGAPQP